MNIETIKTFQTLKTPFYYYDTTLLQATLQAASQAAKKHGFHLHYAIKANANPHILDIIQSHGIGADCVSGNEPMVSPRNRSCMPESGKVTRKSGWRLKKGYFASTANLYPK